MPLFGSERDAKFIRSINRELIHEIISIEVALYKISMADTDINLYNESSQKTYFAPVRLFALVEMSDTTMDDEDTGMNINQPVTFKFLRDDLKEYDVFIDEGDLLLYNGNFYEIDNINQIQFWMGRNPDTLLGNTEGRFNWQYGYNISIIVQTHLTKVSGLNLVENRSGINKLINKMPKNY